MLFSGGGQLARRQHLLSRDGRLLLVCNANHVRVYSAITAELLFILEGHSDEVTSICLHPRIPAQVYSVSLDGTLSLWDLQDGTRVQSWPLIGEPLESLTVVDSTAFVTSWWRSQQAGRAFAFPIEKGEPAESRVKLSKPNPIVSSLSGNLLSTHDRHTVLVWTPDTFGSFPPLALHHTKAITCVAISPDGSRVAAGDVTGRILIWHNIASIIATKHIGIQNAALHTNPTTFASTEFDAVAIDEPPAATVHWHAHAVGCLVFSVDGTYLLSGGHEAVLVMWDASTGQRAYLPRLGGTLVGICPCTSDPAKYALRQGDNTLRIVNAAAMTVEASLHGVRPLPGAFTAALNARQRQQQQHLLRRQATGSGSGSGGLPSSAGAEASRCTGAAPMPMPMPLSPPLLMQPGSSLAVIAGPHAMLQWYDVSRDAHVDKLQLSQRNIVSLTEVDAAAMGGGYGPPAEPAVTAAAFSRDGSVLATVESRPDVGGRGGLQFALKFWDRALAGEARYGSPYRMNTLADQPHRSSTGFGAVTSLSMHPVADVAVTTSHTGEFKYWTRQRLKSSSLPSSLQNKPQSASQAPPSTWRCAAIGSHRNEPLTASAFSSDGSLFALGSETGGVSLWDANEMVLLGTLPPATSLCVAVDQSTRGTSIAQNGGNSGTTKPMKCIGTAVRQLAFLGSSGLLFAMHSNGVALYNVLTMRCEYASLMCVIAAAADPLSSHWAVIVDTTVDPFTGGEEHSLTLPNSHHSTSSETRTARKTTARSQPRQPTEREDMIESTTITTTTPSSTHALLVFDGSRQDPVAAWRLHRGGPGTNIAFLPSNAPFKDQLASLSLPNCSPLMVLSGDREYAFVRCVQGDGGGALSGVVGAGAREQSVRAALSGGATEHQRQKNGLQAQHRRHTFGPSGFEAMFGKSARQVHPGQTKEAESQQQLLLHQAGSNKPRWAALLDAPSHALPAMGTLCPAFLELMVVPPEEEN